MPTWKAWRCMHKGVLGKPYDLIHRLDLWWSYNNGWHVVEMSMHLTRVSILVCVDSIVDEISSINFIEVIMITFVTTLALGLQGCGTRGKFGSHISCSRECRRVWGNEPSHSQMSSHFGSWSPDGFLNLQRVILGIKTDWIMVFLISLESS
jgi:hypothetical protein